jgi:hypothetical protein
MGLSVNLVIQRACFHRAAVFLIGWEGPVSVNVGQPCDRVTQISSETGKKEQREDVPIAGSQAAWAHLQPAKCAGSCV